MGENSLQHCPPKAKVKGSSPLATTIFSRQKSDFPVIPRKRARFAFISTTHKAILAGGVV